MDTMFHTKPNVHNYFFLLFWECFFFRAWILCWLELFVSVAFHLGLLFSFVWYLVNLDTGVSVIVFCCFYMKEIKKINDIIFTLTKSLPKDGVSHLSVILHSIVSRVLISALIALSSIQHTPIQTASAPIPHAINLPIF